MATNFKLKRSAVASKRPGTTDLELGELALNTYDGFLYSETTGAGSTVSLLTPWQEKYGQGSIYYTGGFVGIGTTVAPALLTLRGTGGTTSGLRFLNGAGEFLNLSFNNNNANSTFSINYGGTSQSDIQINHNGNVVISPSNGTVGIGTYTARVPEGALYIQNGLAVESGISSVRTFHIRSAASSPRIYYDNSIADALIFKDDVEARFGDSSDLRIYHNDSTNYNEIRGDSGVLRIRNYDTTGFGKFLYLQSENVQIRSNTDNHSMISAFAGDRVDLYFNNDRKFGTTGYGVTVYGEAQFTGLSTFLSGASFLDNDVLYFGGSYSTGISTDHRLRIYSDGTDSYISEATGAGHLILSSDSRVEIKNAALNHTVASFNTGIGVTVNDRFKVVGIATLGSGSSGQAILQYQGSTKLNTAAWGTRTTGTVQALGGNIQQYQASANGTGNIFLTNQTGHAFQIGHTSSNSFITGHVGNISINAPVVSISTNFSVGGISTFTGNIDANGDLDVDGIVTAGNGLRVTQGGINVTTGISTFGGNLIITNEFPTITLTDTNNDSDFRIRVNDGSFKIQDTSNANAVRFIIKPSGNVGINTTSPSGKLEVLGDSNLKGNLNVTGISTLGSIGISTGRITGPAKTYIDPATVGTAGTVFILGDLQVEGTQTVVNSSTMTVTDKNIELAKGAANDAAADGGGITVESGGGNKTWQWVDATDSWTSSEHIRIPDDKAFGFATDTNTYIGRPAADTIAFTHGGSERVRITSSQTRIGSQAATDTTSFEIQLSGAANNDSILSLYNPTSNNGEGIQQGFFFKNSNDTVTEFARISSTAVETTAATAKGDLRFYTRSGSGGISNSSERLRILSNGDVGIGTVTTSGFLLKVQGSTRVVGNVVSAGSSTTGISTVVGVGTFKDDVYIDKKLYVGGIEIGGPGGPGIGTDITTRHLTVTGLSTFTGAIDANGDLDVDGHTELDNVNVTGLSTFTGAIDANGDLDVDGQTNLDNVSIAGFSTFTSLLNCDGGFSSGLVQIGVSGIHVIDTSSGDLTIAPAGGEIELSGDVGIGTDNPDAKLDVRGTLNVTGVSTFVSFLDVNDTTQSSDKDTGSIITEGGVGIEKNLNVGGIINSSTDVQINGTSVVDSALNDAVAMAIALG